MDDIKQKTYDRFTLNLEKILQMGSRNKNYGMHIHRDLKIVAVL